MIIPSLRLTALSAGIFTMCGAQAQADSGAMAASVIVAGQRASMSKAIAAQDPKTVQWKTASAEMTALFEQWQSHQQSGPHIPKSISQSLWKRFRDARAIVDKHRREFYAELDEAHKAVRERKNRLVERAEALAPRGEDGIGAYRDLLNEWKTAGRAGKKVDDALWARFKAAGDALYAARAEREAAEVEASKEKIDAKRALLERARPILDMHDLAAARSALTAIQRSWDDIGRIFPREQERALDDELRKIEVSVRSREDAEWTRNNPETTARANDMTRQLYDAIEKLEAELAEATARKDQRAIRQATEALEARRAWLRAVEG